MLTIEVRLLLIGCLQDALHCAIQLYCDRGVCFLLSFFCAGVPPFNADTPQAIFSRILDGNIEWPTDEQGNHMISEDCRDLINKLLNPVPHQRLGYRGAGEIKMHKFFEVSSSCSAGASLLRAHPAGALF
jgi:hypothetical protein